MKKKRKMRAYPLIILMLFSFQIFSQKLNFVELNASSDLKEKWGHLEAVLQDKQIVALGESLHGVKEHNATKLELIQYLHEELGFNVLAIESDVAINYFGNLYRAKIADTSFLKELFPLPWHTEEHLEIVRYLKKNPALKIIGFDVEVKNSVLQIQEIFGFPIDSTMNQVPAFLKKYATWEEVNGRFFTTISQRDSTMAEVAKWIVDDLYTDEKIIISAANSHISNKEIQEACMGEILKKEYRKRYYSIGFFHSLGDPKHLLRTVTYENKASLLPKNSLQYKFLETGKTRLFLNLQKQRRNKKSKWIFKDLENVFQTRGFQHGQINLAKSFDGLIWIKTVTHPQYIIRNEYLDK
jgi:erythromycin esterase